LVHEDAGDGEGGEGVLGGQKENVAEAVEGRVEGFGGCVVRGEEEGGEEENGEEEKREKDVKKGGGREEKEGENERRREGGRREE
jgi:hypothetical protein